MISMISPAAALRSSATAGRVVLRAAVPVARFTGQVAGAVAINCAVTVAALASLVAVEKTAKATHRGYAKVIRRLNARLEPVRAGATEADLASVSEAAAYLDPDFKVAVKAVIERQIKAGTLQRVTPTPTPA